MKMGLFVIYRKLDICDKMFYNVLLVNSNK